MLKLTHFETKKSLNKYFWYTQFKLSQEPKCRPLREKTTLELSGYLPDGFGFGLVQPQKASMWHIVHVGLFLCLSGSQVTK